MLNEFAIFNRELRATFLRCDFLTTNVNATKNDAFDAVAQSRTIIDALSLIDL